MIGMIVFYECKTGTNRLGREVLMRHLDYNFRAFEVEKAVVIDVDQVLNLGNPPSYLTAVNTLEEALREFQGFEHVYLMRDGAVELQDYTYPDRDTVYIVGSDYGTLLAPPGASTLKIETPVEVGVFTSTVVGILMYHLRNLE